VPDPNVCPIVYPPKKCKFCGRKELVQKTDLTPTPEK